MVDFRTNTAPPVRLAPAAASAGSIEAFWPSNLPRSSHAAFAERPALNRGSAGGEVTHVADVAALIAALAPNRVG